MTVTETDANGLTATATQQLTVATSIPIGHVGRVTMPDAQVVTSTSATEHVTSVTSTGDALLVGVLLGNTGSGTVSATDTQGNSYQAKALTTSDTVTVSFPSTKEHHVTVDEYSGVSGPDQAKSATSAANTAFSSGATASTSAPNELVVGLVGSEAAAPPPGPPQPGRCRHHGEQRPPRAGLAGRHRERHVQRASGTSPPRPVDGRGGDVQADHPAGPDHGVDGNPVVGADRADGDGKRHRFHGRNQPDLELHARLR